MISHVSGVGEEQEVVFLTVFSMILIIASLLVVEDT